MNIQRIKITSIRRIKREQGVFCTTFSSFREIFQLPFAAPNFWLHRNRKLIYVWTPSPKKKKKYMVVLHCRIIFSCNSWLLLSLLALAHLYQALNSSSESKKVNLGPLFSFWRWGLSHWELNVASRACGKWIFYLVWPKMCAVSN